MSQDLLDSRLDPIPDAPRTGGLLGEIEALHLALKAAGVEMDPAMLMSVSGLAFSFGFRVSTGSRGGQNPQFGWFRPAQWDGPDPLRLAARVAGFDYTAHLVNSTRGMFERVASSIDEQIAVLGRDPETPHHPCLIIGYTCDRAMLLSRALHMVRCPGENGAGKAAGDQQQIRVELPDDPESVMLELGPWRNPIGVLERREPPDGNALQQQIRGSLRRVAARSATRVIGGAGDMPEGDVLDDEVRSGLVRPSFSTWATTLRAGNVDVRSLRIALDDLRTARTGGAEFLRTNGIASGWDTAPAGDLFNDVAAGVTDVRAMLPDGDELPDDVAGRMADALQELDAVESRAMAALKAAMTV